MAAIYNQTRTRVTGTLTLNVYRRYTLCRKLVYVIRHATLQQLRNKARLSLAPPVRERLRRVLALVLLRQLLLGPLRAPRDRRHPAGGRGREVTSYGGLFSSI